MNPVTLVKSYQKPLPVGSKPEACRTGRIVTSVLSRSRPETWRPTGYDRDLYLHLAEPLVRALAPCVDEDGAVIDPVEKREHGQTTSRFASSAAILLAFDRASDLLQPACRAMDHACRRLGSGDAQSPDFQMRELVTALWCLEPVVGAARSRTWREDLRRVNPETHYWSVESDEKPIETLHNWTVFAAAGEWLREAADIGSSHGDLWGRHFFDKYVPYQCDHFTDDGLYRDPHDPMTYDFGTRLQFAHALAHGYDGPCLERVNALLQRGAMTMLLYVTPDGFVPFGGRSSQFHFQEAALSALCELEARRYHGTSDALAGAFKRQARLSAAATSRWIESYHPPHHIKNGYGRHDRHGLDEYGLYSVYALNAATIFGMAALYADDSIEEQPCPADIGGYNLELKPAFHKLFLSTRDAQIEVDTGADFHHDATGIGRWAVRGRPLELGLSLPITATPVYRLPAHHLADEHTAIGPAWQHGGHWVALAGRCESLQSRCNILERHPDRMVAVLAWQDDEAGMEISESLELAGRRLSIRSELRKPGGPMRYIVPLLVSDGDRQSAITASPGNVEVAYAGTSLRVTFDPALPYRIEDRPVANRSGLYRRLIIDSRTPAITLALELT